MDITEWMVAIVAAVSGGAAVGGPIFSLGSRRHLRCVDTRISCPRTGSDVDCTLIRDARTGVYTSVDACSASGAGGRPTCDQDCVRILNHGIPLFPSESPLGREEATPLD